jgi:hypothetical protein
MIKHLNDEHRPEPRDINYDIPRSFLDIIKKFRQHYFPSCDMTKDEGMLDFISKQYMSIKPTEWGKRPGILQITLLPAKMSDLLCNKKGNKDLSMGGQML